ncbi:hypothetical protein BJ508DRAFT_10683 [Ascobolus immersus RN42]|uniref:Uncharacterized protein n=1 Tax=Ascobolus immersus RN42 TaxID=1160509 RepID=A0A3N4HQS4_ASCIM|nr:hypothetical protein BJ508DRAFT_10683 [Ascobolus immersus RN42]
MERSMLAKIENHVKTVRAKRSKKKSMTKKLASLKERQKEARCNKNKRATKEPRSKFLMSSDHHANSGAVLLLQRISERTDKSEPDKLTPLLVLALLTLLTLLTLLSLLVLFILLSSVQVVNPSKPLVRIGLLWIDKAEYGHELDPVEGEPVPDQVE